MDTAISRMRKMDLIVLVLSTLFLTLGLAATGLSGRERARRAVCLANLGQLTAAWRTYADENDGKIVNGAGGFHYTETGVTYDGTAVGIVERAWVGRGWGANWNSDSVVTGVTEEYKKNAIHEGALWPLVGDERCYQCPLGRTYEWVNYSIVDAMNGVNASNGRTGVSNFSHHPFAVGTRVGETVLWIKNTSEIVSPPAAERMVFIDEGAMTPDSFGVHYQGIGAWWDDPPARHNDGATVSWADGHASYRQWQAAETIEFGRRAVNRYYGGFRPVTEEGIKDLEDFRRAVWGRLPSD